MGNGDAQGRAGSAFGVVGNDVENFYLELDVYKRQSHDSRRAEQQYLLTFKMSRSILVPTMKRGAGVESG